MPYPVPGYPHLVTDRPQGTNLRAGQVDVQDVNPTLLSGLDRLAASVGNVVDIFSGYRDPAYSASVGGYANDPHSRGEAVDAYLGATGTTPVGQAGPLSLFSSFGLESGNQPGFYRGGADPTHVQIPGSGVNKSMVYHGGGSAVTPGATSGGFSVAEYARQVFAGIHAPDTPASEQFFAIWAGREGVPQSIDHYNLLGTTEPVGSSYPTNSAGVQSYGSLKDGVQATVDTISQMPGILQAFVSGDPQSFSSNALAQANFLSWSGGGYSWPTASPLQGLQNPGTQQGSSATTYSGGSPAQSGALPPPGTQLDQSQLQAVFNAVLAGKLTQAQAQQMYPGLQSGFWSSLGNDLGISGWMAFVQKWLVRGGKILLGAALMGIGIYAIVRSLAGNTVNLPGVPGR